VWDALVGLQKPIESNRVFDYVRYLLAQKAVDDAPAV
jgi:hypothetical protein